MKGLIDWLLNRKSQQGKASSIVLALKFEQTVIGRLWFADGNFCFKYADGFKGSSLKRIPDFPDLDKSYKSPVLFPFFEVRIPNLEREDLADIVKKFGLNTSDELEILSKLGQRTTSDPYVLEIDNKQV